MSGGYLEYSSYHLEEVAYNVDDLEIKQLIFDLSKFLHDYDYYMSGDYGYDTYLESLNNFKNKWFKTSREERLKEIIDERLNDIRDELYNII